MTEHLTPEVLAALPTVSYPRVSHLGDQAAFYVDWTGRFELYVLDLGTGHRRQVTDGQARPPHGPGMSGLTTTPACISAATRKATSARRCLS